MTKFLILWQLDTSKMPDKSEEQISVCTNLANMVKKDSKYMLDWGEFVGGNAGYTIAEGNEQELALALSRYSPYVEFGVYPVISIDQHLENIKILSEMARGDS